MPDSKGQHALNLQMRRGEMDSMKRISKILVTGGAGFIGSHLIVELLRKGYSIVVFDNLSSGKMQNVRKFADRGDFEFKKGDVRDRLAVSEAMCGVDAVVHLAALIDIAKSVADPAETHEVNVNGTLNVLQEAVRRGVRRFIFPSSAAVYGDCEVLPIKEDAELKPLSPYGASKVSGEAYCQAFCRCYGLETTTLRPFNVYGSGNERNPYSGVITKFLKSANSNQALTVNGDGEQTRDFMFIDDVVVAIMLSLENEKLNGEVFNVCTGQPVSINRIVEVLEGIIGKDLKVKHGPAKKGEIRFSYGDPEKAARILKFRASASLREGLEKLAGMSLKD